MVGYNFLKKTCSINPIPNVNEKYNILITTNKSQFTGNQQTIEGSRRTISYQIRDKEMIVLDQIHTGIMLKGGFDTCIRANLATTKETLKNASRGAKIQTSNPLFGRKLESFWTSLTVPDTDITYAQGYIRVYHILPGNKKAQSGQILSKFLSENEGNDNYVKQILH